PPIQTRSNRGLIPNCDSRWRTDTGVRPDTTNPARWWRGPQSLAMPARPGACASRWQTRERQPTRRPWQDSPGTSKLVQKHAGLHALDRAVGAVMHASMVVVMFLAQVALHGDAFDHSLLVALFDLVHHRLILRRPPELEVASDQLGPGLLLL